MEIYLVRNAEGTKGVILSANDSDEARHKATDLFYSPFSRKNDLTCTQVYDENKHSLANRIFTHVQFHTMGGVSTSYDCIIDTKPTDEQIKFLNKPIEYIKFFNGKEKRY